MHLSCAEGRGKLKGGFDTRNWGSVYILVIDLGYHYYYQMFGGHNLMISVLVDIHCKIYYFFNFLVSWFYWYGTNNWTLDILGILNILVILN